MRGRWTTRRRGRCTLSMPRLPRLRGSGWRLFRKRRRESERTGREVREGGREGACGRQVDVCDSRVGGGGGGTTYNVKGEEGRTLLVHMCMYVHVHENVRLQLTFD